MKKLCAIISVLPFIISCSNNENNVAFDDFVNQIKLDFAQEKDLITIDNDLIDFGIYKPMIQISHPIMTKFINPFSDNKPNYYNWNVFTNIVVTNEYIKFSDRTEVINNNYKTLAEAKDFLINKGYSLKDEVVVNTNHLGIINEPLFHLDDEHNVVYDLVEDVAFEDGNAYLTLKNVIIKDFEGNEIRKINGDDFRIGTAYRNNTMEIKNINPETFYMDIVSKGYQYPLLGKDYYVNSSYSIGRKEGCYLMKPFDEKQVSIKIVSAEDEIDYKLENLDSDYSFIDVRYVYASESHCFVLNNNAGNDNYKAMMEDQNFRYALLSLLERKDFNFISKNNHHTLPIECNEISKWIIPSQKDKKTYFDSINISKLEGIEDAKEYAMKVKNMKKDIEIHTIFASNSDSFNYLKKQIDGVFGDKVILKQVIVPIDYNTSNEKDIFTYNFYNDVIVDTTNYYASYFGFREIINCL